MSELRHFLWHAPITFLVPAILGLYFGRRMLGPWLQGRRRSLGFTALLFVALLPMSLSLLFWSERDRVPLEPLLTVGFLGLGYLLTVFPLLLTSDVLRWGWGQIRKKNSTRTARFWLLLQRGIALVSLVLVVVEYRTAKGPPVAVPVTIQTPSLPSGASPLRIVHLTDLHVTGRNDQERLRRLVQQVNAHHPSLIAITGDILDGPLDNPRRELTPLGQLRAPYGVFVTIGNHELYAGAQSSVDELERLGFVVLLNSHRVLWHDGTPLTIAAVTNPRGGMHGSRLTRHEDPVSRLESDPRRAMTGAPREGLHIFLAHQPRSIQEARNLGFELALGGHTHGGQYFPYSSLVGWVFPYPTGHSRDGSMNVIIGRGLGTFGPPLRSSAPELTVVTLRPQSS